MSMLNKLIQNKFLILFILVHALLFNVNVAEWGDSYRILRASEYIRDFSYPEDEKRPPFFSILLSLRPEAVDQVMWGRVVMFGISLISFIVFQKLMHIYELSEKNKNLANLLFIFNPVYLYWSLRIMADVPFTLLVLLVFYIYKKWHINKKNYKLVIIGILVGLAVLTRFEGYILGFAVGLDLLLRKRPVIRKLYKLFYLSLGFLPVYLPWFFYRNPLTSSYFEEPSGRVYDFNTVFIYFMSLFFLFGFTSALFFFLKRARNLNQNIYVDRAVFIFLALELLLALAWPAAIPRLFVPVIPFLIIYLAIFTDEYFSEYKSTMFKDFMSMLVLLGIYVAGQYVFRLQFLVLHKMLFGIIIFFQLLIILSSLFKKRLTFMFLTFISSLIWGLSTIYLHSEIFRPVKEAALYANQRLTGVIAYNDVSSVSDWYINQKGPSVDRTGIYLNMDSREGRSFSRFEEEGVNYALITNEHNPDLEFNAEEAPYLELITEFSYTIRGEEFFAKIVKFNKDFLSNEES